MNLFKGTRAGIFTYLADGSFVTGAHRVISVTRDSLLKVAATRAIDRAELPEFETRHELLAHRDVKVVGIVKACDWCGVGQATYSVRGCSETCSCSNHTEYICNGCLG